MAFSVELPATKLAGQMDLEAEKSSARVSCEIGKKGVEFLNRVSVSDSPLVQGFIVRQIVRVIRTTSFTPSFWSVLGLFG